MKARNRKTDEIVYIVAYSQYTNRDSDVDYVSYIDSKGVEHFHVSGLNYYWDFEPVEEHCSTVDWENRRYEIAKSIIQGMAANPELTHSPDYIIDLAKSATAYADALIKELKECN